MKGLSSQTTIFFACLVIIIGIKVSMVSALEVVADLNHEKGTLGTFRALIIGIQNYNDPRIPDLETPVKDVNVLSAILQDKYNFEVVTLVDEQATKGKIDRVLRDMTRKSKPDDSVLIYFAGHGDLDKTYNDGWWIPHDAKAGEPVTYLDNTIVQKAIRAMKARHVLIISDSCYSGTLFGQIRSVPQVISDKYYLDLYNEKSRWGLTSGNRTPVSDSGTHGHSVFAYQLIKKLKNNVRPYISIQEIYTDIAPVIGNNSEQTPMCRPIKNTGDQGGAFVFVSNLISDEISKPALIKPKKNKVVFDDIIQLAKEKEKIEKDWGNWLIQRKKEYNQVLELEKSLNYNSSEKKEMWVRFLSVVSQNNPYSSNDDKMKEHAKKQALYWGKQSSKTEYYNRIIPDPDWPEVSKGSIFNWNMVTTFPKDFPLIGENYERFAKIVKEKSKGRLNIKIYPAGKIVNQFDVFGAVSKGEKAQVGGSVSHFWKDKTHAAVFFATIPFGLNTQGMLKWLHQYGGMELWEEVYKDFNIIPRPAGTTQFQMGGWFNKKIASLDDLKGLKMRMGGLGSRVLKKAGVKVIKLSGGKIYSRLERGHIHAAEWLGPFHDKKMKLYKVARYYYYPGWQEPGTNLEFIFNRKAYLNLPKELQLVIDQAALVCEKTLIEQFESKNLEAYKELIEEHGVNVINFPDSVLKGLNRISDKVLEDFSRSDDMTKKVYKIYQKVQTRLGPDGSSHEKAYYYTH